MSVEECEGVCEYVCMCVKGEDEGVMVGMRVCQCVSVEGYVKVCELLMYACPLQESRRVVLGSSEKTRYRHSSANIPQSDVVILIIFTALNTLVLTLFIATHIAAPHT